MNQVTPAFFKRYPDPQTLAAATPRSSSRRSWPPGFFRQKSKMLLGMAQALLEHHGGQVPADMDALTALPGVGRKTANVVLGHALGVPGLPVDRHVLRVANRIGIAQAATPEEVETQLCAALPREHWTLASVDADPARPPHLPADAAAVPRVRRRRPVRLRRRDAHRRRTADAGRRGRPRVRGRRTPSRRPQGAAAREQAGRKPTGRR